MRHRAHAQLCALVAALVLATAAAHAGAEAGLSLSNQSFRSVWTALSFEAGFGTVRCPVTLEGSFHARTFAKTAGSLVGYVSRATAGACTAGTATVLSATLPWHVTYSSFTGTLPNITGMNASVSGAAISIRESGLGITCLFRSSAERPLTLAFNREAGGAITTAAAGGTLPENACGFGVTARVSGSGTVTLTGSTARITLALLEAPLGLLRANPGEVRLEARRAEEAVTLTNTDTVSNININLYSVRGNFEWSEEERCRRAIGPGRSCTIRIRIRGEIPSNGEVIVEYSLRGLQRRVGIEAESR